MSFPSLLVILFWGAGRLASVRFLCQFCFNIVDTYDINRSISMTCVTLWVTKKNPCCGARVHLLCRVSIEILHAVYASLLCYLMELRSPLMAFLHNCNRPLIFAKQINQYIMFMP
ncbi:hypothetical protein BDV38DRAFT_145584 [Aspergillus pseudotamarii]|uniref:Secreted protein n=1 Tax=Aspergillus pseudotamarii TaxID=132259 RepID=A0A5N6SK64_ASPPS|nr:uncharacterized protein BDV38DRAFT_145584 [Aspergillus pseudotamarii]KAE8134965.1 hypothetical protein BDV38DRAFT_145584 [Aspergillus pseudotamarii]